MKVRAQTLPECTHHMVCNHMINKMADVRSSVLMSLFAYVYIIGCFWDVTNAVDSTRFIVLGDWGGLPTFPYKTHVETSVASQMSTVSSKYGPEMILALGDNFYYDGVTNVNDHRFKRTFEDVYSQKSLDMPWYFVAGNHDHNGNVSAQIAYTNVDKRWNFPNYYYKLSLKVPNSNVTIDIIMIDTVILCGNSDYDQLHLQPKGPENFVAADDQWKWINDQLANSKSNYLLVAGHYPVYSIAEHGPTKCLVDKLLPLLQKYKVTAYLNGHDHNLQHIEVVRPGLKMDFFTIGAANFVDTSNAHKNDVPPGSSKFFWAKSTEFGGFAYVETMSNNMTLTFIDGKGLNLYTKVVYPRV